MRSCWSCQDELFFSETIGATILLISVYAASSDESEELDEFDELDELDELDDEEELLCLLFGFISSSNRSLLFTSSFYSNRNHKNWFKKHTLSQIIN